MANSLRYLSQVCGGNEGSILHLFEVMDFLNLAEEWKARNCMSGEEVNVADKPGEKKRHALLSYLLLVGLHFEGRAGVWLVGGEDKRGRRNEKGREGLNGLASLAITLRVSDQCSSRSKLWAVRTYPGKVASQESYWYDAGKKGNLNSSFVW